jgi:hypothetical protein
MDNIDLSTLSDEELIEVLNILEGMKDGLEKSSEGESHE